jgi:hypothetical protein
MKDQDYVLKTVKKLQEAKIKIPVKTQILINFDEIKANIAIGMKVSQVYQVLIYEKKIDCTYPVFCNVLKKCTDTRIELSLKENITSKEKEETTNNDNQNKKLSFDQIRKERQLKVASLNQPQMKQRTIEDVENNINDLL